MTVMSNSTSSSSTPLGANDASDRRAGGDPRRTHVARHRIRIDAHQGVPDRRRRHRARGRQPRVGEPLRGARLDLLARRRVVGPAGRLRRPRRRCRAALRCGPRDDRRDRRLGDDARLPRVRRRRRAARAVPHLAQHDHRPGCGRAVRTVRHEHPAAVVDRPPPPGRARRRAARSRGAVPHHARRLRALAAHRAQGARRRRRLGHVPDRFRDQGLRPGARAPVRRPRRRHRSGAASDRRCCPRCSSPAGPRAS